MDEFIRLCLVRDDKSKVSQELMYARYLVYCDEKGLKPRKIQWFGREMNMFGYGSTVNRRGELEHLGVRLRH